MNCEQAERRAFYQKFVLIPAGTGMFAAIVLSLVGNFGTAVSSASQVWISAGAFFLAVMLAATLDVIHQKESAGQPDKG